MSVQATEPIRLDTLVDVSPQRAWEVFTAEITAWWPLETHSVLVGEGRRAEQVVLEARVGGELYEQAGDERAHWGTILVWEPPHRLTVEWRVNPSSPPTQWTASFIPEGAGTRVEIVHTGWEAFGELAMEQRSDYGGRGGWPTVLERLEEYANT